MSSGNVWVRLVSVTVTLVTVPMRPETEMVEGYGVAEPTLGMVIAPVLENKLVAGGAEPSVNVLVIEPKLIAPSWSRRTAVSVPPHVPLAVNVNGVVTEAQPATNEP